MSLFRNTSEISTDLANSHLDDESCSGPRRMDSPQAWALLEHAHAASADTGPSHSSSESILRTSYSPNSIVDLIVVVNSPVD